MAAVEMGRDVGGRNQRQTLTAAEVEFIAEDVNVFIIPSFEGEEIHLIADSYGPFKVNRPVEVPLWLALQLKKQQKCSIQAPEFMDLAFLEERYAEEKDDEHHFEELPFHYLEISSLLLSVAADDIPNKHKVRTLVENIWEVRTLKIRNGLRVVDGEFASVQLNNLCAMEIQSVRGVFTAAMEEFHALRSLQDATGMSATAPASGTSGGGARAPPVRGEGGAQQPPTRRAAGQPPARKLRRFSS